MGFTKTDEEIKSYEKAFSDPTFFGRKYLTFEYETTQGAIERVVPPPLTVSEHPSVFAWIGDIERSNCIGGVRAMGLFVRAKYQNIAGLYAVTMAVDTEAAAIFGRSLYGEPKKMAQVDFENVAGNIRASVSRHGITYMEATAGVGSTKPIGQREFNSFFFKYSQHPSGAGFDGPPHLVLVRTSIDVYEAHSATGQLILRESRYDPVCDLPVEKIRSIDYTESNNSIHGEILCNVDPESFKPFAFATIDTPDLLENLAVAPR